MAAFGGGGLSGFDDVSDEFLLGRRQSSYLSTGGRLSGLIVGKASRIWSGHGVLP